MERGGSLYMFCTAPEAMVLAEAGDGEHSMGNTREQDCCFQQQPAFTLSSTHKFYIFFPLSSLPHSWRGICESKQLCGVYLPAKLNYNI